MYRIVVQRISDTLGFFILEFKKQEKEVTFILLENLLKVTPGPISNA